MAKRMFIVTHPKLCLKVDGKMKRIPVGTKINMESKHADSLVKQGKLLVKGEKKPLDVGDELKQTKAELKKAQAELKKSEDELKKVEAENSNSDAEVNAKENNENK